MGKGSTACIDLITEKMSSNKNENALIENNVLSEFANGCLTLLRANGNNKQSRNMKIVKYAIYILRAMVAILLILDKKKSSLNRHDTVFGNNENKVKCTQCVRMITSQFISYYSDNDSINKMQGINNKTDIEYHVKYCKRIIKFGAAGFKNDEVKRSIQNMLE